jgi:hypothetical protein
MTRCNIDHCCREEYRPKPYRYGSAGTRTRNQRLKRALLYRLSYRPERKTFLTPQLLSSQPWRDALCRVPFCETAQTSPLPHRLVNKSRSEYLRRSNWKIDNPAVLAPFQSRSGSSPTWRTSAG